MSAIPFEHLEKFREFDKDQREQREEESGALEEVGAWIKRHPIVTTLAVTSIGAGVLGYLSTTGSLANYPWLQNAGEKVVQGFGFVRQEATAFINNPSQTVQRWWYGVQEQCNKCWDNWFPGEKIEEFGGATTEPGTSWPPPPDPNAPVPYEEPPIHGQAGEPLPVPHGEGLPAGEDLTDAAVDSTTTGDVSLDPDADPFASDK